MQEAGLSFLPLHLLTGSLFTTCRCSVPVVRTEGIVEFPLRLVYHFLYSEQGRNSWDEASNRKMGTRHGVKRRNPARWGIV
jgi:hypothetical protein